MTDIKKLLGLNIRAYRLRCGFTQEQLAEKANTATNYLGMLEGGKKFPSAEMIEKIAFALHRDTADLFSIQPLRQDWQKEILADIEKLIMQKITSYDTAQ